MCNNRVVYNRVVYHEPHSALSWTTVYGEELLNFLSVVDNLYINQVASWREGRRRYIGKEEFEECLSRFPLEYVIDVEE